MFSPCETFASICAAHLFAYNVSFERPTECSHLGCVAQCCTDYCTSRLPQTVVGRIREHACALHMGRLDRKFFTRVSFKGLNVFSVYV